MKKEWPKAAVGEIDAFSLIKTVREQSTRMRQSRILMGLGGVLLRRGPFMRAAVILFVFAATACALLNPARQAKAQPTSTDELLNSRMAYDNCLLAAARNTDDGKSDARTIALAMKSKCIPQTERVITALARVMTSPGITAGRAYVTAKSIVEEQFLENAVKAVLSVRTGKVQ